jgi:cholesterol oxidase
MSTHFDAIVIGSGFGGAIMARRLAEQGMRVLVLERGRRWDVSDYPRKVGDAWIYSHERPERHNGWMDLRVFGRMAVAQAAGVGGGSLAYSSVAVEADPEAFTTGWPTEITYAELKPYYDIVAKEMDLQVIPDGQLTPRFVLARDAARNLGHASRFSKAPLAVSFSKEWSYELDDPFNPKHSQQFVNAHGQRQGTCIHLGNCDIGCDVRAKNSLDMNYIPRAEQRGAEVRPLHLVRFIEPRDGKYRVVFDRLERGRTIRGEETATRVVFAAGSLCTTELLLRCRDQYRTLPALSPVLGTRWSPNANFISLGTYAREQRIRQSAGPTIAGLLDFTDGAFRGERFVVEDDGFPNLLLNVFKAHAGSGGRTSFGKRLLRDLEERIRDETPLRNLMVWLGAGRDAGDGEFRLKRRWLAPWRRTLRLNWDVERSTGVLRAIEAMHTDLTEATGGRPRSLPTWSLFKSLLTLHPLGGCPMDGSTTAGVVDHLGRVHGYRNLFVADGAIVPAPTVRNPSHTIAALAERIAAHLS